mgnify:CR=1 FL=1
MSSCSPQSHALGVPYLVSSHAKRRRLDPGLLLPLPGVRAARTAGADARPPPQLPGGRGAGKAAGAGAGGAATNCAETVTDDAGSEDDWGGVRVPGSRAWLLHHLRRELHPAEAEGFSGPAWLGQHAGEQVTVLPPGAVGAAAPRPEPGPGTGAGVMLAAAPLAAAGGGDVTWLPRAAEVLAVNSGSGTADAGAIATSTEHGPGFDLLSPALASRVLSSARPGLSASQVAAGTAAGAAVACVGAQRVRPLPHRRPLARSTIAAVVQCCAARAARMQAAASSAAPAGTADGQGPALPPWAPVGLPMGDPWAREEGWRRREAAAATLLRQRLGALAAVTGTAAGTTEPDTGLATGRSVAAAGTRGTMWRPWCRPPQPAAAVEEGGAAQHDREEEGQHTPPHPAAALPHADAYPAAAEPTAAAAAAVASAAGWQNLAPASNAAAQPARTATLDAVLEAVGPQLPPQVLMLFELARANGMQPELVAAAARRYVGITELAPPPSAASVAEVQVASSQDGGYDEEDQELEQVEAQGPGRSSSSSESEESSSESGSQSSREGNESS